ncbi:MAG TPA: glycosyltransferase family 39 protein [Ktedonobacteraceae bacterium]|jgi:4-amino-4-deoxy-L-arabinose transferase-like glycosyltransferase
MIQLSQPEGQEISSPRLAGPAKLSALFRLLSRHWELYLIIFLALFLRLIHIDNAIFNDDEVNVFRMAHDALVSGWIPLTSNRASLGNLNPPLVVYFFLLPAAISPDPLWGQVMVALFNAAAIVLTYVFVRRYYGRLAGTIAALLYATSAGAWIFSRNIWPQNFLPFFVMLFLLCLFRGVVDRHKGWFFWAVLLLGVLYQFHGSSLYLLFPLAAAACFAYQTIRLRDLVCALAALLILFGPYLLWEYHSHFADITVLFSATSQQAAHIDSDALRFYLFYIHPTLVDPYIDPAARLRDTHLLLPNSLVAGRLHLLLSLLYLASLLLLVGGVLLILVQIFTVRRSAVGKHLLLRWWSELWASPQRQGLVLLLLWQVVPLVLLTRHSIVLFVHYFLFLLPGQFILIALCSARIVALVGRLRARWQGFVQLAVSALAAFVILAQLVGLGGALLDIDAGHFQNTAFSNLSDQQRVLQVVEQVARQRHIDRVYLTAFPSYIRVNALDYLAHQHQIPLAFFTSESCFILPSPAAGPVLFLTTANNTLATMLFARYTNATLVATSPHAGSLPYQIFVVTARPVPNPVAHAFGQTLHLLSPAAQLLQERWLVTRWSVQDAYPPALRTTYAFRVQVHSAAGPALSDTQNCTPTLTWPGDQLFMFHYVPPGTPFPSRLTLQASTSVIHPQMWRPGPFVGFTFRSESSGWQVLLTEEHAGSLTVPVVVAHP